MIILWYKRITAFILSVLLSASVVITVLVVSAQDDCLEYNKKMLENILNERPWIIDVLVRDQCSEDDNPFNVALTNASRGGFLNDVVDHYDDDDAYRFLVGIYDFEENASNYISQYGSQILAEVAQLLGGIADNALLDFVTNEQKTVDSRRYEAILTDVFTEDYTSTSGISLLAEDTMRQKFSDIDDYLSKLSHFSTALSDASEVVQNGLFDEDENLDLVTLSDYADHFLKATSKSIKKTVEKTTNVELTGSEEDVITKSIAYSAFAFFSFAEQVIPTYESILIGDTVRDIYDEVYAEPIKALLSGAGNALDFSSTSIKYMRLLHSLATQYDTTVATMRRISEHTSNTDLVKGIEDLIELYEDPESTADYIGTIALDYVKNKNFLANAAVKKIKKEGWKAIIDYFNSEQFGGAYDPIKEINAGGVGSYLADIGKGVAIGAWVGNALTNIKTSAKKTYICLFTKKVISAAVASYNADYRAYMTSKTEENAKKVLDDLEYLKRLRLYGEKNAYESTIAMTDSLLGKIIEHLTDSEDLHKDLKKTHEDYNDMILGCIFAPCSTTLTVNKGEELVLRRDAYGNGRFSLTGVLTKKDGTIITIPELNSMMQLNVILSGGTLRTEKLHGTGRSDHVFIPQVVSSGGVIYVGDELWVDTFSNTGNLNIVFSNENGVLNVVGSLINSSDAKITLSGTSASLSTYELFNFGTITMDGVSAHGNAVMNDGKISGGVLFLDGNGIPVFDNGYSDPLQPSLSGTGTIESLVLDTSYEQGLSISGALTVSKYLRTGSTRIRNGENLTVSNNCVIANNVANCSLTFNNYTANASITLNGFARIKGTVNLAAGGTFNDGIELASSCRSLTLGADATVKGEFLYYGGTISGIGCLKLLGDMTIGVSDPQIARIDLIGNSPQKISSSYALTVAEFGNHNYSRGGVTVGPEVIITGKLSVGNRHKFVNGKNVLLSGTAVVEGDPINGSLSAEDWIVSGNMIVNGDFYASGDMLIPDQTTLKVKGYSQKDGTLTIGVDSQISVAETWYCAAAVTNHGEVIVNGLFVQDGSFTGGTLSVKDDVICANAFKPDELIFFGKTAQQFTNSGESTVKRLTVNNTSKPGVTFNSLVTVTENYSEVAENTLIRNGTNIKLTCEAAIELPENLNGSVVLTNSYRTKEGKSVKINGSLDLRSGASVTVSAGSTLTVYQSFTDSGGTVTVEPGGRLIIRDYLNLKSGTVTNNGEVTVVGDTVTSGTVGGSGDYIFKGDLSAGGTWNTQNIKFESGVPQYVSGGSLKVKNLTIGNTSRTGITFLTTVSYSGTLTTGNSVITGAEKLIKK